MLVFIVCVKFLTKFYQRLEDKAVDKSDTEVVETQLMKFCKETRDDKEERFVSYPKTPPYNYYLDCCFNSVITSVVWLLQLPNC